MAFPNILPRSTVKTLPKVMVNNDVIFTVVGDIQLVSLTSECVTANDTTASTLQYKVTTVNGVTTISGVSASLASAAPLQRLILDGGALSTAPALTGVTGVGLNTTARGICIPDGTIGLTIGIGSTTGTWIHYISYNQLEPGAYVY